MNLGTQKWKKARANFYGVRDDAGRCGTACTRACPWDAHCLPARGEITSFSKKPSFLGNHSKAVGKACIQGHGRGMQPQTKAKACSQGHGQGMHPRPRARHAAKAKAAPMGRQRRPRHACVHAAKAKARSQGHGMLAWARWHAPGRRQQQGPSMHAA